jgi:hypothetical protein
MFAVFALAILLVAGVVFLMQGVAGMLAGSGVLLRRQWGRIVTFILAVPTILWGSLCLLVSWGGPDEGWSVFHAACGTALILYGIFALIILIKNGPEFSRRLA